MKIVALIGSRREGNTSTMVRAACAALDGQCDTKLYHLKGDIAPCDGCLQCDETGLCHIQDTMQNILPDIAQADGLIIGTPARWGLLSGELKVMMDRLNPLAVPETLKGKKAIIFAVGQGTPEHGSSIERARDSVATFCDNAGIDVVESVVAYNCLDSADLAEKTPDTAARCAQAARKLVEALK